MRKIIACLLVGALGLSVNAQGVFQRMINEARNEINRTRQEYQRNNNSNQRYNNSNDSRSLQYSPYGTRPNTNNYNRSSSTQYSRPTDNSSRTESYSPRSANSSTTAVVSKPEEKTAISNANNNDEVTIVVSGDGTTKSEAIALALRSAIERTFGTFVSANTTILNDDLVKDEIVSITTGNIKKYEELSSVNMENGNISVTLKAVVSISKLVSYTQNHGGQTELAGKEFAMQMKMEKFNKESEKIALKNMKSHLLALAPNLFNYEVQAGEPEMISTDEAKLPILVSINATANTDLFNQIVSSTLKGLSVDPNANIPDENKKEVIWDNVSYYLRNHDVFYDCMINVYSAVIEQFFSFKLTTQNANEILFFWKKNIAALGPHSLKSDAVEFTSCIMLSRVQEIKDMRFGAMMMLVGNASVGKKTWKTIYRSVLTRGEVRLNLLTYICSYCGSDYSYFDGDIDFYYPTKLLRGMSFPDIGKPCFQINFNMIIGEKYLYNIEKINVVPTKLQ